VERGVWSQFPILHFVQRLPASDVCRSSFWLIKAFQKKELYTSDIKAISHITSNATIYKKGPVSIRLLTVLFGKGEASTVPAARLLTLSAGILSVEDDEHRKQAGLIHSIQ
jgi:hypothetical protein